MSADRLYLRRNVVIEPLFNQWYAWWYLVPPSTAALYLAHQHLKIMRSFVAQPMVHVAAMTNPELVGGPYINLPADRVEDVSHLIDRTVKERAPLLELAEAIKALDGLLAGLPAGSSLEEAYRRVPEPLQGMVELIYDRKNNASFRFIEALLYRSKYDTRSAQSVALWRADGDLRPFIFSTPRLEAPDRLHIDVPFGDPLVDDLVALREAPAPLARICSLLDGRARAPQGLAAQLRPLLTEEPPPPPAERYRGEGVRIRYFGHACLLVETRDVAILTDPIISYPCGADLPRYSYDDLPEKIDYVLLTHAHADHLMFETLLQLRRRIGALVVPKSSGSLIDPSLQRGLAATGFRSVVELDELDELPVPGGKITGIPFLGEHGDLGIRSKLAFALSLQGKTVMAAADSNVLEPRLYDLVREITGPVDALFLGMECEGAPMSWAYGPMMLAGLTRKMDQSRRLNGCNHERASALVTRMGARQVYIYAMGQEPWLGHVMALRYEESSPQIVESNRHIEHSHQAGRLAERLYCQKEIFLR